MSCPDWRRLAAGDEFLRPGVASRRAALEHAASCRPCRREALRLDPSLAVAELPVADVTRSEVESIRDNVLALRRTRRLERDSRPRRPGARWAAVACLAVAALLFGGETTDRSPGERAGVTRPPQLLSADYRLYGSLPLVESLEPAEARVYQLGQDDFSLVWIVDESIEVTANP